jgi:HPt (histidine-containing phosphotransfer) domain-containing protein
LPETTDDEPPSIAGETDSPAEVQPAKRKRTPRKKKEKAEAQVDLFGGYDSAKDEAGPVRVTLDHDGIPVVSGLDLREALNRLELPVSAVVKMVIHFAEGLPQTFGELRTALAAADHETARRHAHSVAGTAGTVAADTLRRLAKTLELALKFEQGDAARMLADLEHEAGRVMEAARQLAATVGAADDDSVPVGRRKLLTILEELAAVLDDGEIEVVAQAVGKLKSEKLPEVLQADYDRLSERIDNFEYADAAGIVRSMMERVP